MKQAIKDMIQEQLEISGIRFDVDNENENGRCIITITPRITYGFRMWMERAFPKIKMDTLSKLIKSEWDSRTLEDDRVEVFVDFGWIAELFVGELERIGGSEG